MTLTTTSLGTYTFPFDPKMNTVHKAKDYSSTETYSGQAFDDWGFKTPQQGLIGGQWTLEWTMLKGSDWTILRNYYESAETVTFSAGLRAHTPGAIYTVKIVALDPDFDHRILAFDRIQKVTMVVNIRATT